MKKNSILSYFYIFIFTIFSGTNQSKYNVFLYIILKIILFNLSIYIYLERSEFIIIR